MSEVLHSLSDPQLLPQQQSFSHWFELVCELYRELKQEESLKLLKLLKKKKLLKLSKKRRLAALFLAVAAAALQRKGSSATSCVGTMEFLVKTRPRSSRLLVTTKLFTISIIIIYKYNNYGLGHGFILLQAQDVSPGQFRTVL